MIRALVVVALVGLGCGRGSPPAAAPRATTVAADPDLHLAQLGRCALESGRSIEGCRLGYRTFGTLNAARDNAVLVPTWFTGTSKDLAALIPGPFVDPRRFFLILVDAFGNGVSSSPSNSAVQPRLQFPQFTIRDLVEAQLRMLESTLGIHHLHAVVGISMGGMQALQWSVSHPTFMDRVVAMAASPRSTSQDLLLWTTELHAIVDDAAYRNGEYAGHPTLRTATDVMELTLWTPGHRAFRTKPADLPRTLAKAENDATLDWNDRRRQVEALLTHDVSAPYGGSLVAAAERMRARTLIVVAERDLVVSPIPALQLAKTIDAETLVLESACGHLAVQACETAAVAERVSAFLGRSSP